MDELLKATERSQVPFLGDGERFRWVHYADATHGIGIFTQTFLLNVAYVAIFHLSCR